MGKLQQLQSDFQNYLIQLNGSMDHQVVGTKQAGAMERLEIYADAYRLRLLEALQTDYVALHALLGEEEFDRLGRAYIDSYQPRHFSIRYYGDEMATFLASQKPYSRSPWLSETAAFEWAQTLAFDAADAPVAAEQDMAAYPPAAWPRMRFIPHSSVQRLDFYWNIPQIWKAATHTQPLPEPQSGKHPRAWVIWRQQLNNYYRSLEVDEAWAINAFLKQENFADICAGLCEWVDELNAAAHAASLLKRWIIDGLIQEIRLPQEK